MLVSHSLLIVSIHRCFKYTTTNVTPAAQALTVAAQRLALHLHRGEGVTALYLKLAAKIAPILWPRQRCQVQALVGAQSVNHQTGHDQMGLTVSDGTPS